MAFPLCVKCGKKIKPAEAKVVKQDKLLGKVVEHAVCPF